MTPSDQTIEYSPLNQLVTRDGGTVQVYIYKDVMEDWLLEVVDDYGNSTLWDARFESDQTALAEVLMTIEVEGIGALISEPFSHELAMVPDHPLSNAEMEELDDFLARSNVGEAAMNVSRLEGFLTCIAIGPSNALPLAWLPWVWDTESGQAEPSFDDDAQETHIMSLIMRLYHSVMDAFGTNPESFEPLFLRDTHWGAEDWCEGFVQGFEFNVVKWCLLSSMHPGWLTPFLSPETDRGIALDERASDAESRFKKMTSLLVKIHQYWRNDDDSMLPLPLSAAAGHSGLHVTEPIVRASLKIGRNDPCPCNSGKKYKKCCGANAT